MLWPGAKSWKTALFSFAEDVNASKSPKKAALKFSAGLDRLQLAQKEGSCWLNFFYARSRSAALHIMIFEVKPHPVTNAPYDGIKVSDVLCVLRRNGALQMTGATTAYANWHGLGRLYERSDLNLYKGGSGAVGMLGLAGMIMRESRKHEGTNVNLSFAPNILITGVMRGVENVGLFFDMLTTLPGDEPKYKAQWEQGALLSNAVFDFARSEEADPSSFAARIPVIEHTRTDYATAFRRPPRLSEENRG
jgi:hypothetical protein